jgi:hypothetical protein
MIPVTIVPAPFHSHFTSPVRSTSRCPPVICSGTENADAGVGSRSIRGPAIPSRSLPDCVLIPPISVTVAMLGPDGIPTAATHGVLARGIRAACKVSGFTKSSALAEEVPDPRPLCSCGPHLNPLPQGEADAKAPGEGSSTQQFDSRLTFGKNRAQDGIFVSAMLGFALINNHQPN